jgi:hypothetical protein
MLNHVRSVFVRLTVLSMLVFTVGAGGCSSGKGIRTSAAGGTTGTGGVTTSTGGSTSTSGGTTSTTGGATSYAGTSGTTGGSTGTTGGTGGGGTGGQGDCICDFVPGGTTGSDAPPCASQIEIASLADVPFVAAPRWVNEYCSDSYYGVQITPDLVATTALVLDAYEIAELSFLCRPGRVSIDRAYRGCDHGHAGFERCRSVPTGEPRRCLSPAPAASV